MQGLRNILYLAHDYDVGTLTPPSVLKELQSEVESSHRVLDSIRASVPPMACAHWRSINHLLSLVLFMI